MYCMYLCAAYPVLSILYNYIRAQQNPGTSSPMQLKLEKKISGHSQDAPCTGGDHVLHTVHQALLSMAEIVSSFPPDHCLCQAGDGVFHPGAEQQVFGCCCESRANQICVFMGCTQVSLRNLCASQWQPLCASNIKSLLEYIIENTVLH